MTPPPAQRPWWSRRGTLSALAAHLLLFTILFQLHFAPGEWKRMKSTLSAQPTTTEWYHALVAERGVWGVVIWFFDTHDEIRLYHRYGEIAVRGIDPNLPAHDPNQGKLRLYRDVPMEYQPGALLFFAPPALFTADLESYQVLFILWIGAIYTGAMVLGLAAMRPAAGGYFHPARALWASVGFLLAFGVVAAARFDAAVPLVAATGALAFKRALAANQRGWFVAVGAIAGAGAMIKLVPGVVLPAAALWVCAQGPDRLRRLIWLGLGFTLTVAALHGAFLAAWGSHYLSCYTYHLARGIQIESTYAGLLMALHGLGHPLSAFTGFGGWNLASAYTDAVKSFSPLLFGALAVLVSGRAWHASRKAPPDRAMPMVMLTMSAFLLAFMLTSKVLSPQYLVWLAPLLACGLAVNPRLFVANAALIAAAGLSQLLFPHLYDRLVEMQGVAVAVLNLRNAILAGILAYYIFRLPSLLDHNAKPKNQQNR